MNWSWNFFFFRITWKLWTNIFQLKQKILYHAKSILMLPENFSILLFFFPIFGVLSSNSNFSDAPSDLILVAAFIAEFQPKTWMANNSYIYIYMPFSRLHLWTICNSSLYKQKFSVLPLLTIRLKILVLSCELHSKYGVVTKIKLANFRGRFVHSPNAVGTPRSRENKD